MKHFYVLIILGFLLSCQREEHLDGLKGNLDLTTICAAVDTVQVTRAVDNGLIVEIWKDGALYVEGERIYRFLPGHFPKQLSLPIGDYVVKAFSASYEQVGRWTNVDKGEPVYFSELSVNIVPDKVCRMRLEVPMLNTGVSFSLPEELKTYVKDFMFTISQSDFQRNGERVVSLIEGQTAYVDAASFSYKLVLTNVDGEQRTLDLVQEQVEAGKNYRIVYTLVDRTSDVLSCVVKSASK